MIPVSVKTDCCVFSIGGEGLEFDYGTSQIGHSGANGWPSFCCRRNGSYHSLRRSTSSITKN